MGLSQVVTRFLGYRGYTERYEARQVGLGRLVMVEVVRLDLAHDLSLGERLLEDARGRTGLLDATIPTCFDCGRDPTRGFAFAVYELARGDDIVSHARRHGKAFDWTRCAAVGIRLARVLERIHEQGYVHGTLQPSSVIVSRSRGSLGDRLRLVDFDPTGVPELSRRIVDLAYVDPEAIVSDFLRPRADVRALGILLFELATGHSPFARTSSSTLQAHLYEDAPAVSAFRPDVPQLFERLIAGMLMREPTQRVSSLRDVEEVLVRCLSEHDPSVEEALDGMDYASTDEDAFDEPSACSWRRPASALQGDPEEPDLDGVLPVALARLRTDVAAEDGRELLVVTAGPARLLGLRFPLRLGSVTIGRGASSGIALPHVSVSAAHCGLTVREDGTVTVAALVPDAPIRVDEVPRASGALGRGGRLGVGDVELRWLSATDELPAREAPFVALPMACITRARPPSHERLVERTHRLFAERSPARSEPMRDAAERANVEATALFVRSAAIVEELSASRTATREELAEALFVMAEVDTQLRILERRSPREILEERLLHVEDWDAIAGAIWRRLRS